MKVTKFKINEQGLMSFSYKCDNGKPGTVSTVEKELFQSQLEALNANMSALMNSQLTCTSISVAEKKKKINGELVVFQVVTAAFDESRKVGEREIFGEFSVKKMGLTDVNIECFDSQNVSNRFSLKETFALFSYKALQEIETIFEENASKLLAI